MDRQAGNRMSIGHEWNGAGQGKAKQSIAEQDNILKAVVTSTLNQRTDDKLA